MAATVTIRRWTGSAGGPTKTNVTSINTVAGANDTHATTTTGNEIRKPDTGTNYSYWVSTRLSIDAISGGVVDNIRWYSDGSNSLGTGIGCVGNTADGYVQATGTSGTTGTELTTGNHANLSASPVSVFTHTSGSPKAVTGSGDSTGDLGHFFVYNVTVGTTAGSGETATETFTWVYDDTSS
jgi:hypothetical protein